MAVGAMATVVVARVTVEREVATVVVARVTVEREGAGAAMMAGPKGLARRSPRGPRGKTAPAAFI